jgi:hypothetical protein
MALPTIDLVRGLILPHISIEHDLAIIHRIADDTLMRESCAKAEVETEMVFVNATTTALTESAAKTRAQMTQFKRGIAASRKKTEKRMNGNGDGTLHGQTQTKSSAPCAKKTPRTRAPKKAVPKC